MKQRLFASFSILLLQPQSVPAAETGQIDYWTLGIFLTANFLITAGLFGVGIVVIGLFYDHFKPWLKNRRALRDDRKWPN